jgi:hypothetical protein
MTNTWWEAPMGGFVLSFLEAEWKVSDTGSAHWTFSYHWYDLWGQMKRKHMYKFIKTVVPLSSFRMKHHYEIQTGTNENPNVYGVLSSDPKNENPSVYGV